MKTILVLLSVFCATKAAPRIMPDMLPPQLLTLPSNATSIRADISDSFSCEGREYGYYADVDNDCQLFHICLPVMYSSGRQQTFRWSFICPEETVFNQEVFSCTRADDSIDCAESPKYYMLNRSFGDIEDVQDSTTKQANLEGDVAVPDVNQDLDDKRASIEALKRSFSYHR